MNGIFCKNVSDSRHAVILAGFLATLVIGLPHGFAQPADQPAPQFEGEQGSAGEHDPEDPEGFPEGLEDIEAIEELEARMFQDLTVVEDLGAWSGGIYEGLQTSEGGVGVQLLTDTPSGLAPRFHPEVGHARGESDSADGGNGETAMAESAAPLPVAPLDRFDLSGISPLFGIDDLDRDQIQVYLHFWTTRGRSRMARLLARGGRYRDLIQGELEEAGLPRELFYLVMIESGFVPTARSHAAAVGLWQFMARTGRGYGLRVDRRVDERRDPERATQAGIAYLSSLHDRLGSWPLAMAAYNAGGGHVRSELRRYDVSDFWAMDEYGAIWDDTRAYVYKIIAAAIIGENPHRFGFDAIEYEPAVTYDTVMVRGDSRLSVFADALDVDVDLLEELNPALLVPRTPSGEEWPLHIPEGMTEEFVESYDRVDPADLDAAYVHRVRVGETLETVAEIFGLPER
ncbi:MAG: transglycosylase SLT domain-containing protein, partial [Myxococcales bacterium]|nr:transglycosylase SLT domain-containing protein [Myxococcales bacterium]